MSFIKRNRPSPAMIIAVAALSFALVGTAVAGTDVASKLTKSKVKKIARKQADKELRANISGSHVNEADHAKNADNATNATNANHANNADNATNATNLDGQAASNYLRTNACQPGSVLGYARVLGQSGTIPATYTSAASAIDQTRNCSGAAVEVRKEATGRYFVRFLNASTQHAFVQVRYDTTISDENEQATVERITTGADAGAFRVSTFTNGTNTFEDVDFSIEVL
jgi:hypothetical protein